MKRTERHHLKENVVASSVTRAQESFERNRRQIIAAAVGILVLAVAVGAYFSWRSRVDARSRVALAEAMAMMDAPVVPPTPPPTDSTEEGTPAAPLPPPPGSYPTEEAKLEAVLPKLMAVADAYPSAPAGIAARYHAAAALAALNRTTEAVERYQDVIARGGQGLYGDMARLGLAEARTLARQYEPAIEGFRELATRTGSALPVDGVLMQLARTYVLAGKKDEATRTFRRIVEEFPDSIYRGLAQKELDANR